MRYGDVIARRPVMNLTTMAIAGTTMATEGMATVGMATVGTTMAIVGIPPWPTGRCGSSTYYLLLTTNY